MRLSVNLVSWNGAKYIPYLMQSLKNQSFKDWSLFVFDNNSTDNTVELIKRETEDFPVFVEIVENKENLGFAGGHNAAFKRTESDYVMLLNQDTYLAPDYLDKLVEFMDSHNDVAAVSGRLIKWEFGTFCHPRESGDPGNWIPDQVGNDIVNGGCDKTNIIDSLGFKVFRNRRVVEIGAGKEWERDPSTALRSAQDDNMAREVFGVSGTLPMYCREALQEVAYEDGNIFDSLYESYKEDVDLAYRLQLKGFKAYVLPNVVAYHDRTGAGPSAKGYLAAIKNKKNQSPRIVFLSYRNHLMNLYKNEMWQNVLLDFFLIFWYEIKKFVYYLIMDRAVLGGWSYLWLHRAELKSKRQALQQNKKISWKEFRKWL